MTNPSDPIPSPTQRIHEGAASGTWNLDPTASTIAVAVKHFWGAMTVRGTFTSSSGHAEVDTDGTISATLTIEATSIETKNKKRDKHLRSEDFFDVEHHATITFTTTDVTLVDDTTVRVSGVLTAAHADQSTTFDASISAEGDRATINAETTIDHRALGMTWSPLGMTKPTTLVTLALAFTRG